MMAMDFMGSSKWYFAVPFRIVLRTVQADRDVFLSDDPG
jgi:hypothetical protein